MKTAISQQLKTFGENSPSIFLTDWASYNEGTQFEFGHWVDLQNFSSFDELQDYISDHFRQADKISPLFGGTPREEILISDYEHTLGKGEDLESFKDEFLLFEIEEEQKELIIAIKNDLNIDLDAAIEKSENVQFVSKYQHDFNKNLGDLYAETLEIPQNIVYYFDFEQFGRDIALDGYTIQTNAGFYYLS
jgi:hypothetical protein